MRLSLAEISASDEPIGRPSNLVIKAYRPRLRLDLDAASRHEQNMRFASHYESVIGWIVSHCGGSDKFAHTYAGLLIWLVTALLCQRAKRRFEIALVMAILLELLNESIDRIAHGSWRLTDTLGDAAATWFWPTMLTAAIRWRPSAFQRSDAKNAV